MFELGQPVVVQSGDGQHIGEVIGEWGSAGSLFYDVSLLQTVRKAVPQHELRLATASEVNGLLSSFMTAQVGAFTERDVLLRHQYTMFLARALSELDASQPAEGQMPEARFGLGDKVALREDDALVLGIVRGRAVRNAQAHYLVETLGEERMVPEDAVLALGESYAGHTGQGMRLGERVRFVAPGHENDDDFLGVVCSVRRAGQGAEYAILFDDGDVLEGLSSADLRLA